MVEAGHGFRFGLKTRAEGGILAELLGQDFNGDGPVQGFLDGTIHGTHPTGGDQAFDLVAGKQRREFGRLRGAEVGTRIKGITHDRNWPNNRGWAVGKVVYGQCNIQVQSCAAPTHAHITYQTARQIFLRTHSCLNNPARC